MSKLYLFDVTSLPSFQFWEAFSRWSPQLVIMVYICFSFNVRQRRRENIPHSNLVYNWQSNLQQKYKCAIRIREILSKLVTVHQMYVCVCVCMYVCMYVSLKHSRGEAFNWQLWFTFFSSFNLRQHMTVP